jgi:hypothetical protein
MLPDQKFTMCYGKEILKACKTLNKGGLVTTILTIMKNAIKGKQFCSTDTAKKQEDYFTYAENIFIALDEVSDDKHDIISEMLKRDDCFEHWDFSTLIEEVNNIYSKQAINNKEFWDKLGGPLLNKLLLLTLTICSKCKNTENNGPPYEDLDALKVIGLYLSPKDRINFAFAYGGSWERTQKKSFRKTISEAKKNFQSWKSPPSKLKISLNQFYGLVGEISSAD